VRIARLDAALLALLLVALLARTDLANIRTYIHDESNNAIPLAQTISFAPGNLNLPLRGQNHGALPAYVVHVSSTLFGTTRLGYRMLHVILGTATILLVALVARQWFGPVAALWTAALLAFNGYFLFVSSRATAHVPYLFFVAVAVAAFSRFLAVQRAAYLYASTCALGLAFYSKEHAVLLLPLLMLALLGPGYRRWLRSPHPYLACVLFLAILAPDFRWNATTDRATARVTYGDRTAGYATYQSHLERIGGIGLSPYPLMFYARSTVKDTYRRATGRELVDETEEYPSMHPALGVLLLVSVALATIGKVGGTPMRGVLLLLFWGVFGFFTLIKKGSPPGRLDPVSWIWVESTLVPSCILAGAWLAALSGRLRVAVWAIAGAVLIYGAWLIYR
jgi:4-amino-4-deoxy-L-arabinose transferase-like glycosyltransferase